MVLVSPLLSLPVGVDDGISQPDGKARDRDNGTSDVDHLLLQLDSSVSAVASAMMAQDGVCCTTSDRRFCVSIADPSRKGVPFLAVSDGYETMTEYSQDDFVGNSAYSMTLEFPIELWQRIGMQGTCDFGSEFSTVLVNRTKSGRLYRRFVSTRGLTIGRDSAGDDFWVIIGIHADLADFDKVPEEYLKRAAEHVRTQCVQQFGIAAVLAARNACSNVKLHEDDDRPDLGEEAIDNHGDESSFTRNQTPYPERLRLRAWTQDKEAGDVSVSVSSEFVWTQRHDSESPSPSSVAKRCRRLGSVAALTELSRCDFFAASDGGAALKGGAEQVSEGTLWRFQDRHRWTICSMIAVCGLVVLVQGYARCRSRTVGGR